jgi:hypothetical protein
MAPLQRGTTARRSTIPPTDRRRCKGFGIGEWTESYTVVMHGIMTPGLPRNAPQLVALWRRLCKIATA